MTPMPDPLPFTSKSISSPLLGRPFCTYGPWVVEELHERMPEIHPSEQIWFEDGEGLHWIVMQDDSDRFGNENYCPVEGSARGCERRLPTDFRSWWTSWSLRAKARVPFELPGDEAATQRLTITEKARGPRPATSAREKTFVRHGAATLEVSYPRPSEAFLLETRDRCVTPDGKLLGYVDVYTVVDARSPEHEGEGFHHLVFSWSARSTQSAAPALPSEQPQPVFLCTVSWSRPIFDEHGEIIDLGLWVRDGLVGEVTVEAEVTDPFDQPAPTAERTFVFPLVPDTGLRAGLDRQIAQWVGVEVARLRRLWRLDRGAETSLVPECSARARRARLLHLYTMMATRDAKLSEGERRTLETLAAGVKELAGAAPCPAFETESVWVRIEPVGTGSGAPESETETSALGKLK